MTDHHTSDSQPDDPVEGMDKEHKQNPAASAAPPEDTTPSDGPSFAADGDKTVPAESQKAGLFGVAGRGSKKKKPKKESSAAVKRRKRERERQMKMGVRYGGGRWMWVAMSLGLVLSPFIGILSLIVASGKADDSDVATAVDERLEEAGEGFPEGQAVMWAGKVLREWGTWDEENAEAREVALSPYLSQGMDTQAGWNEEGTQTLLYSSVNPEPNVVGSNHALISASYQIQDGSWRCVTLPVFAYEAEDLASESDWAFALAGNPTPSACSPRTGAPSIDADEEELSADGRENDNETAEELADSFFPGFFAAWASSDTTSLEQYASPGVRLVGLGGAMASTPTPTIGDAEIYLDENGAVDGETYLAYVPVTWNLTGSDSQITAAYIVPVTQVGGRWQVADEPYTPQQGADVGSGEPATIPDAGDGVAPPEPNDNAPSPEDPPEEDDPSTEGGADDGASDTGEGDDGPDTGNEADPVD